MRKRSSQYTVSQNSNIQKTANTVNLVGQIGCIIGVAAIIIIAIAFGIGWLIDDWLGNDRRYATMILMIGSFPVTLFVMVQISMNFLSRANKRLEKANKNNITEELDKDK